MLKIRLKRLGAKKAPTYRIIVINSTTKREGKPIEELGYYNPKTKEMKLNIVSANEWVKKGAQPTDTVKYLMANCNADGTLNYKKSETVKLSKKAQVFTIIISAIEISWVITSYPSFASIFSVSTIFLSHPRDITPIFFCLYIINF